MMYILLDLSNLNFIFSIGGLILLVVTAGLFFDYYFNQSQYYLRYVSEYVWPLLLITTIGGVVISLLYSEYFGFIPCSLCWLQRIGLYPLALFSVVAFKIKDNTFYPLYGIALSLFGLAVAIYQYLYQMLPKDAGSGMLLPCLADGSADCAAKIINEFGFVTFPFLSGVIFLFLIVLHLNQRRFASSRV